ncbi:hypothetical protein BGX27_006570, partial [Mortierella sp. AM989]
FNRNSFESRTNRFSKLPPMVIDTKRRKVIRSTIMEGDIDKAMEMLEEHYPGITTDYSDMLLQLRCRKFVEMAGLASTPLRKLDQDEFKKARSSQISPDTDMKDSSS